MLDTIETVRRLTAQDRCDRCGAQAYFIATKSDFELLFCAHHARLVGPGVLAQGFTMKRDELAEQLATKPGASA